MQKKLTLSYPYSQKILGLCSEKEEAIRRIADMIYQSNIDMARDAVNKCLIEVANKQHVSLYDVCFHTVPKIAYKWWDDGVLTFSNSVELIPVEFDLTHDGGYWKQKYFKLKERMRELADSKDDEMQ